MRPKVFIIAEIGVNHNGSIELAKKLVDAAKLAGADAVKFQTFRTKNIAIRNAPKAAYQKKVVSYKTQYEMLKKLELSESAFSELFKYCRKKRIIFLSTPFDIDSSEFLNRLGVSMFKISSGDLTNIPLLDHVARFKKPIILSTGMSSLSEVRKAVKVIFSAGNKRLTLLHCTSNYPARYEDVNLKAMETLKKAFRVPVGYSDHTCNIEISIGAVALNAAVIEKHFTLDKTMPGPDHAASLEANEFKRMIAAIRNVEKAIGSGIKRARSSESEMIKVARKSIVATCRICSGKKITKSMIGIKRPGTGISPSMTNKIIGKKAKNYIEKDTLIKWEDVL